MIINFLHDHLNIAKNITCLSCVSYCLLYKSFKIAKNYVIKFYKSQIQFIHAKKSTKKPPDIWHINYYNSKSTDWVHWFQGVGDRRYYWSVSPGSPRPPLLWWSISAHRTVSPCSLQHHPQWNLTDNYSKPIYCYPNKLLYQHLQSSLFSQSTLHVLPLISNLLMNFFLQKKFIVLLKPWITSIWMNNSDC